MMLMDISGRLETVVELMKGATMKENPTPSDRDWYLRLLEQPHGARDYMADILARGEARRLEREKWNRLSVFRRLFTPRP